MITETSTNNENQPDLPLTTFGMKTRTRFGTWNVRTLLEASRLAQLCKEFKNYNLLFLGLCEIRWPDAGESATPDGCTILYSGKPNNLPRSSGVGFLLSKRAHDALISWKPYSDRVISIRLRTRARNLTCIQCYAPTEAADRSMKDEFYKVLDKAITTTHRGDILVVMGDFNAQIGPVNTNLEGIMGTHALGRKTDNGEIFLGMCAANNLVVGGSLFPHKRIHKVTWESPDLVTENQIDHITISRKWRGSLLDVRNRRGADLASDHHLLVATMRIKLAAINENKSQIQRRIDVRRMKNVAVTTRYTEALTSSLNTLPETQRGHWNTIKNIFMEPAINVIGYTERTRKEWISDETWSLIESRKAMKAAVNMARTRTAKNDLKGQHNALDRLVKKSARRDKRNWTNEVALEAQIAADTHRTSDLYRAVKKLSHSYTSTLKPLKNDNGDLITSVNEQMVLWEEFYSNMLATRTASAQLTCNCRSHSENINIETSCPVLSEVVNAINSLKSNKSPGLDGISPELLKADPHISAQIILPLITDFWVAEALPSELKEGVIFKIPKKGDLKDRNNWRGITLLSMVNKIIAHIITKRISDVVTPALRNEQAGFRPHKSCIDHVNSLRVITEQSVEWRSSLYLCFIDFEKAFDTLDHNVIWSALICKGVPTKLISLIKSLYHQATCRILHERKLSKQISVGIGVRQGCVLSPLLFNIVLDTIMTKAMQDGRGIRWGLHGSLSDLDYADDICIMTHSFDDMTAKLQQLSDITEEAGLKINIGKTKTLRINAARQEKFHINNHELEDVHSFCYLGSIITNTGGSKDDIENRVIKARQTFGRLKSVWSSRTLSRRVKLKIFETNVKSILLYGCETWNAAPRDILKLQVFANQCLRRIMRIFWPNVITNNRLWAETKQHPVATEIKKRKWNWIGHILRRPSNDITRNAIDWNPQGNRRIGRPAHTWRRQIDIEAAAMNRSWGEIKFLAQDKSRWNIFVEALCSL